MTRGLRCGVGWHVYTTIPQNVIRAMRQSGMGKHPPNGLDGRGGYVGQRADRTCFYCGTPDPNNPEPRVTLESLVGEETGAG